MPARAAREPSLARVAQPVLSSHSAQPASPTKNLFARPSPASLGQTFSTASELGVASLSQSLSIASQPN